jgi:hypothetical protein
MPDFKGIWEPLGAPANIFQTLKSCYVRNMFNKKNIQRTYRSYGTSATLNLAAERRYLGPFCFFRGPPYLKISQGPKDLWFRSYIKSCS